MVQYSPSYFTVDAAKFKNMQILLETVIETKVVDPDKQETLCCFIEDTLHS